MNKKSIFTFAMSMCIGLHTIANPSFWKLNQDAEINIPGERKIIPNEFKVYKLSTADFNLFQKLIPSEESGLMQQISLPTPAGQMLNFKIFEAPMMELPLANKYPEIKTYTAICESNSLITAKIDYTPHGFHALVFDGENTYFIDPYSTINTDWYIVYYKHDFQKTLNERMRCEVDDQQHVNELGNAISLQNELPQNTTLNKQNGSNKRTYRLALACTVEYSLAVNGPTPTKGGVLAAMVTSMNRVNGVFEREFSMHANLVGNNDTLIWITAAGEPYSNTNGSSMLGQNQTQVTQKIGSANYDFGHVFSTGGGGIASLGSVCGNQKAQGVTGSSNPVGDPFDIDYVAHEMGHQFGGEHTFNSVTGSCSGNRSSTSAYEIGSATTIQGYAGICGTDDIQTHSDDYYHVRSLEQMTGTSVMACATNVASGNSLPVLAPIVKTYIVPYKTPFELTATGTDADNDPLTYCWEEYDRGGSGGAWDATTTSAPILRSFLPTVSKTRTFPTLKYLLQNIDAYKGEILPPVARTLRFRCTLRDLKNGYGSFSTSTDTLKLDVRTTTSLYRVTSQSAVTTWNAGTTQTITWDVAGTSGTPFNATTVDISLSIDSGRTFPNVLALNVPNNGSATIQVPYQLNSNFCRVKVKASNNVFFDLNDAWIKVKDITATVDFSENVFSLYPNPASESFNITLMGNANEASVELINSVGTVVYKTTMKPSINIQSNELARGFYFVKVNTTDGFHVVKKNDFAIN